jgi:hypothetical protein
VDDELWSFVRVAAGAVELMELQERSMERTVREEREG